MRSHSPAGHGAGDPVSLSIDGTHGGPHPVLGARLTAGHVVTGSPTPLSTGVPATAGTHLSSLARARTDGPGPLLRPGETPRTPLPRTDSGLKTGPDAQNGHETAVRDPEKDKRTET